MPRPPILPTLDWTAVFNSGLTYDPWLKTAESQEQAEQIEEARTKVVLGAPILAYLKALERPIHVIAIAEAWCGDVIRHVPVLETLARACHCLQLRYIARGQHPDVFARFLTNGGEAIPKFVFLNNGFVECGNWGPMPDGCRELIARGKACGDIGAARKKVSGLYETDHNLKVVIAELLHLIDIASTLEP